MMLVVDDAHPRLPIDPDLAPDDPAGPSQGHRPTARGAHPARVRRSTLPGVALGGAIGASARWLVADLWPTAAGAVPWATVGVNVSGALVLGVVIVVVVEQLPSDHPARPFLAAGVLGSFTTMSAFQVETALLFRDGHGGAALVNVAATLVLGIAAAVLGLRVGRRLVVARLSP